MCVEFTTDWYKTQEDVYAIKLVRVVEKEENKEKYFKSLFTPYNRVVQYIGSKTGEDVVYELQKYHEDEGDYGFYLYPMSQILIFMGQYKYSKKFCVLLVRIPIGTFIREGLDTHGRKSINAKMIYTIAVLRDD